MLLYIILSPPKQLMLFAVLLSFVFYAMQILYSSVFRSTSNLQCRWQEPRPRMYRFCVCLFFQMSCTFLPNIEEDQSCILLGLFLFILFSLGWTPYSCVHFIFLCRPEVNTLIAHADHWVTSKDARSYSDVTCIYEESWAEWFLHHLFF